MAALQECHPSSVMGPCAAREHSTPCNKPQHLQPQGSAQLRGDRALTSLARPVCISHQGWGHTQLSQLPAIDQIWNFHLQFVSI